MGQLILNLDDTTGKCISDAKCESFLTECLQKAEESAKDVTVNVQTENVFMALRYLCYKGKVDPTKVTYSRNGRILKMKYRKAPELQFPIDWKSKYDEWFKGSLG